MILHPDHVRNRNFDAELCQRMIEYRARNHLTQEEFAARIGVTTATVVNAETGRRGPSKTTRVKILDEIGED